MRRLFFAFARLDHPACARSAGSSKASTGLACLRRVVSPGRLAIRRLSSHEHMAAGRTLLVGAFNRSLGRQVGDYSSGGNSSSAQRRLSVLLSVTALVISLAGCAHKAPPPAAIPAPPVPAVRPCPLTPAAVPVPKPPRSFEVVVEWARQTELQRSKTADALEVCRAELARLVSLYER